jgi:hypothetical protein
MKKKIFLILLTVLVLTSGFVKGMKKISLGELYISSGRFIVSMDKIITIDNKDYNLKVFGKDGKLIKRKCIKGNGPGEVSTFGTFIFPDGNGFILLESQKRKWLKYNKDLKFIKEGKLEEPVTFLKRCKKGYIAGEASFTTKYYRKIYLYSGKLKNKKLLFTDSGKKFGDKMDTNELYILLDNTDDIIVFFGGNKPIVNIIDFSGKLLKKINLEQYITPSKYNKEELSGMSKNIPPEVRKMMKFKEYPPIIQLLCISNNRILIVSGEKKNGGWKSFIFNTKNHKLKEIKSMPTGDIFVYNNGNLYIMSEGEDTPYVIKISIKEVL